MGPAAVKTNKMRDPTPPSEAFLPRSKSANTGEIAVKSA